MLPNELAKPMTLLLGPLLNEEALLRIQKLEKSSFEKVILIDGASHFFKPPWPDNWELIGDADSCPPEMKKHFDKLLPTHKDQSDLSYALEHRIPQEHLYIHAEGLNGGALDHEIINLGELTLFLEQRAQTEIFWGPDLSAYSSGAHKIQHRGNFSLFSLKEQHLSLSGDVKWPLKDRHIPACSSLTLSNQAFGQLQIECQAPVFFYKQIKDKL